MDSILSRCVKLANLPTDCTRPMLEMILENAPGENLCLDQHIENAKRVDAKTWIILFNTAEDGQNCVDKGVMEWLFETSKETCKISTSHACRQDVPSEWINSDELLKEQPTRSSMAQNETEQTTQAFTAQKGTPIQPIYVIVPQTDDFLQAVQMGTFQQGLQRSPKHPHTFTFNSMRPVDEESLEVVDGIERPTQKEDDDHIYMEVFDTDVEEECESREQRKPVPSPRHTVHKTRSDTKETNRPLPPPPIKERHSSPNFNKRKGDVFDYRLIQSQSAESTLPWPLAIDSLDREIVVGGVNVKTNQLLDCCKQRNIISDIDIENVSNRPLWNEAVLRCRTKEVAERIIHAVNEEEPIAIDGSTLTAILHKHYPYDTHKIAITGLQESFTADEISQEITQLMCRKPTQVTKCHSSALVSLATEVATSEIESLNKTCSDRGSFTLSPVRRSSSIRVSCLGHHVNADAVREYFEVGNVTEIKERENEFIILFKPDFDVEVFSTKEVHMIGGHDVRVSIYYSCLEVTIPPPFLYPISPYLRRYVQSSDQYKRDTIDILDRHSGEIMWPPLNDPVDYIRISCTKAYAGANENHKIAHWKQGCIFALNDICKRLDTKTVYVSKEAWKYVKSDIRKMHLLDSVKIECLSDNDCAFVVSGEMSKVKDIAEDILITADRIESTQLEEKRSEKFHTKRILKESEFDILMMLEIRNTFPKTLNVKEEYPSLVFHGASHDIKKAMDIVTKALSSVYEQAIPDLCDLSQTLLSCGETKEYIYQRLRDDNFSCVFADILRQIHVFSKNEDESRKAITTVKMLIKEETFQLDENSRDYFTDKKGETSLAELAQKYRGQVKYKLCANRLTVVCVDKVYERIDEAIRLMIDMRVYSHVVLNVDPGALQWNKKYRQPSVNSIIERYEKSPIPLTIKMVHKADKSAFEISGIKEQCKEARLSLIEMWDSIIRRDLPMTWSSNFLQFLSSLDGVNSLTECENSTQCVIKSPIHEVRTTSTVLECNFQSGSIEYTVLDLTEVKADCLVRPTTSAFDFTSGLSQQILNKGGNEIQAQCERGAKHPGTIVNTAAGLLQVKGILHAVLDKSSAENPANNKAIRKFITNCMTEADKMSYESIAFPVICDSYFGFPTDVCADSIPAAVLHFWQETGLETSVKKVYLCNIEEEHIICFEKHAKKHFSKTRKSPDISDEFPPDNIKLGTYIIKGNLVVQEADVIVNVTNPRLDLKVGALSKQLLDAGGSHIQTDCRTKYREGLSNGEIARTTGGNLKCKELFHCVLEQWDEGKGYSEMVLRYVISTCLSWAHKKGYMSIAFPALGCGTLQYPTGTTAKAMFEEVKKFRSDNPESNLIVVRLVILPTLTSTIQDFEECHAQLTTYCNTHRLSNKPKPARSVAVNADSVYAHTIGPVMLYVRQGDIRLTQTTAFVNAIGEDANLEVGNISRMVLKEAGKCIQHEVEDDIQRFKDNRLVVTSAGRLLQRNIIHVKSRTKPTGWKETIMKCLIEAGNRRLTSLSFPLVGTGCMGNDPVKIVRAMVETFSEYIKWPEYKAYLKTIEIVVYKKEELDRVISEVESIFNPPNKRFSALPVMDIFKHKDTDDVDGTQKLKFHIYGETVENVIKAEEFLKKLETQETFDLPKGRSSIMDLIKGCKRVGIRYGVHIDVVKDRVSIVGLGRPAKVISEKIKQEIIHITTTKVEK